MNALALKELPEVFDIVIDSGRIDANEDSQKR